MIVGDFNLPTIDWEKGAATGVRAAQFLEACKDAGMEQLINFPTQLRGNILDLVPTNIPDRVQEVKGIGCLGKSDHTMVLFKVIMAGKSEKTAEMIPNWHKADWMVIKSGLRDIDWDAGLGNLELGSR